MIMLLYLLLVFMSWYFFFMLGDVVLIGILVGVGFLYKGDEFFLQFGDVLSCSSIVKQNLKLYSRRNQL